MKKPLTSAGIGVASGSVAAFIQWIFTNHGYPVPAEVLPFLTGVLIYVGHIIEDYVSERFAPDDVAPPSGPAPTVVVKE